MTKTILEQFKHFFVQPKRFDPDYIDNSKLYIVIRWLMTNPANAEICSFCAQRLFYVDPLIIKHLLNLGIDRSERYLRLIRPDTEKEDEVLEQFREAYCRHKGLSRREYDDHYWQHLKNDFGDVALRVSRLAFYGIDDITPKRTRKKIKAMTRKW